jgi:hypothetical protein
MRRKSIAGDDLLLLQCPVTFWYMLEKRQIPSLLSSTLSLIFFFFFLFFFFFFFLSKV